MQIFITQVKKLKEKLSNEESNVCNGNIQDAIVNSRLNGLYYECEDYALHLNRFDKENKDFIRFTLQIKTQNNAKVKNIESIMKFIRLFELQFIYIDKIKVYQQDGVIYLDIFRLNNF